MPRRDAPDPAHEAAAQLVHAASLLFDPLCTPSKRAAALLLCGVAMLKIADSDPGQGALEIAVRYLQHVKSGGSDGLA